MGWRMVLAVVSVDPSADGLPGGAFVQTSLNWLAQVTLWSSLASLLVGGAVWGLSQQFGNGYQAGRGRAFAIGGAIGAVLAALAAPIVNALFGAAGGP